MAQRGREETLRLRLEAAAPELLEHALAEAWEAGALGAEERHGGLDLYVAAERGEAVRRAVEALGIACGAAEPVAPRDWSTAWRAGLGRIEISPRLALRPSFVPAAARPGQAELVIDPGQAFGTGDHATTRLALELLDAEAARTGGLGGGRVLDVGCGTGVLALAALALGGGHAHACDLDPLASAATRANAVRNGCGTRVAVWTGSLEALGPGPGFRLVLANMIRSELMPLLPALAAAVGGGGALVLSGLLATEEEAVRGVLLGEGLEVAERLRRTDPRGDAWLALLARRPGR